MRITLAAAVASLLVALALSAPAGAATQCSYPASAYSTGGAPGGGAVNDPLFPRQWGLTQINAPAAWQNGYRGAGVTIAVVDTGVDLTHPDLQAHLVPGDDLDPGSPGDLTTPALPKGGECPGPQDENGHGTHVAGIAAAVTNNGIGAAGTAPDASVMPVRVLDATGSAETDTVIAGIRYAADHGAKVINLSLGDPLVFGYVTGDDQKMADAIAYAFQKGAVVVAAAGNDSLPLCSTPSDAQDAVCVAATDKRGAPSSYSNFPVNPNGNVALRAPGGFGTPFCENDEDIWSTIWPGSGDDCQPGDGSGGEFTGYDTLAGTSMATPYVSGVAALLAAKGLTNGQILECLRTTSSNKGSYDPVYGYGIVDAAAATSTCSQSTPAFAGRTSSGGTSGGSTRRSSSRDVLIVRAQRMSKRQLARKRRIRVRVTSSRPVTVKLRGMLTKRHGKRGKTLARRTLRLSHAGTKTTTLRLSRRGARLLLKRGSAFRVLYRAGARAGAAGRF